MMTIGHQSRVSMENFDLIKPSNLILDEIEPNLVSPDLIDPQENSIVVVRKDPIQEKFRTPQPFNARLSFIQSERCQYFSHNSSINDHRLSKTVNLMPETDLHEGEIEDDDRDSRIHVAL